MLSEEERKAKNRERSRRYYYANLEKVRKAARESGARRYAEDPEGVAESVRRWRAAHPQQVREMKRKYRVKAV